MTIANYARQPSAADIEEMFIGSVMDPELIRQFAARSDVQTCLARWYSARQKLAELTTNTPKLKEIGVGLGFVEFIERMRGIK